MRNWCDYGLALALGSCFLSAGSVSYSASDDAGDREDGVSQVAEQLKLDRRQMAVAAELAEKTANELARHFATEVSLVGDSLSRGPNVSGYELDLFLEKWEAEARLSSLFAHAVYRGTLHSTFVTAVDPALVAWRQDRGWFLLGMYRGKNGSWTVGLIDSECCSRCIPGDSRSESWNSTEKTDGQWRLVSQRGNWACVAKTFRSSETPEGLGSEFLNTGDFVETTVCFCVPGSADCGLSPSLPAHYGLDCTTINRESGIEEREESIVPIGIEGD